MAYQIKSICTKCGACIVECPTSSIIEGKKHYLIDADTCADHAACVQVCPVDAIVLIPTAKQADNEEEEA